MKRASIVFLAVLAVLAMVSVSWGLQVDRECQLMIPRVFRFEIIQNGCSFDVKKFDYGSKGTESNPNQGKKKTRWEKAKDNANSIQKGWYYSGIYRFIPKGNCRLSIRLYDDPVEGFDGDEFTLNDITMLMSPGRRVEEILPAGFKKNAWIRSYLIAERRKLADIMKNQPQCIGVFVSDNNGFISRYIPKGEVRSEEVSEIFTLLFAFDN